jgi:hypothetical protein
MKSESMNILPNISLPLFHLMLNSLEPMYSFNSKTSFLEPKVNSIFLNENEDKLEFL